MKVSELVYKLDYLASHNMIDENTEVILFAEQLPGVAVQLDSLGIDVNGNMLQLFMKFESYKGKTRYRPND